MPKLDYFLVAKSCSIDQDTNLLSAFEILDGIRPSGFPSVLPEAVVISSWLREPDDEGREQSAALRIVKTSGDTLELGPLSFTMGKRHHRLVMRVQNLPVELPGELRFELTLNGEARASRLLFVDEPNASPESPEGLPTPKA